MDKEVQISIVFLLYNGLRNHFKKTLRAVLRQETEYTFEIIAVDSGSTDGTVRFVKKIPRIRLHEIPNLEFNHGKTRQLGAELAKGEFIVYLTQDAMPKNALWLDNLIRNFEDQEVVGVCSRVIPYKKASLLKKIEVHNDLTGGEKRIIAQVKRWKEFKKLPFSKKRKRYYFFNDVSSAIRGGYVMKNPFKPVPFAEDVEFARNAFKKGKKIVFEPKSVVCHSHDYTIMKTYRRNYIDAKYHRDYLKVKSVPTLRSMFKNTLSQVRKDISEMRKYEEPSLIKFKSILYSPFIHLAEQLGQYNGGKD